MQPDRHWPIRLQPDRHWPIRLHECDADLNHPWMRTVSHFVAHKLFILYLNRVMRNRVFGHMYRVDPDQLAHHRFHCPLTELLDTTECMNGKQRSGWYLAHTQYGLNLRIFAHIRRHFFFRFAWPILPKYQVAFEIKYMIELLLLPYST